MGPSLDDFEGKREQDRDGGGRKLVSREMSEEGPKLYANKPKKGQIKQFQEHHPTFKEVSSSAGTSSDMASQSSSSPIQPPKESFARRYKFLWPMLLTVNLAVGVYLFTRTKNKDSEAEIEAAAIDSASITATAAPVIEEQKQYTAPAVVEPPKLAEPIAEDRQRELFKWILEEKRKMKSKDPEEKKRVDEEKAILKQFIRAKTIPKF